MSFFYKDINKMLFSDENQSDINKKSDSEDKNIKNKLNNIYPKPKFRFNIYWIYGIIIVVFLAIQFWGISEYPMEITYNKFEKDLFLKGYIDKIIIVNKEVANVYLKKDSLLKNFKKEIEERKMRPQGPSFYFNIGSIETFDKNIDALRQKIILSYADTANKPITQAYKDKILQAYLFDIRYENKKDWLGDIINWILLAVLFIFLWMFIFRKVGGGGGAQIFNFGKAKATLYDKEASIKINFNDVAGLEEAKVEIMEIVDFLKNPKKYTKLGGKIPKGVLLVGPPGTGKTLLAKAVAGEAQVPFFSISGSDFVEMFVGVGASRVRDLFKTAKEKAPCIIFIDEIDAIGRARGKNPMHSGNDERESTLNQLLTEMDGFSTNSGVIVLAATNRADILDKALLRAGRFDRQIHVELPELNERKAIFLVHSKNLKLNDTDDIPDMDFLASHTPGFSGADIANVCNEAALIAARNNKQSIGKQDFLNAIDRIVAGLEKRSKIISDDEKKIIAYHEAGHATVSWFLKYANPLIKVTIVPRGKSLGAAWYLPEEKQILNTDKILDEMTATLGGRAAEEVVFGKVSTGALNDLERVTKQSYAMVSIYGMNKKLGNISYYNFPGENDYNFFKPYSEKTAEMIDEEVKIIVEEQYNRAKNIINDNIEAFKKLADELMVKEVIYKEDLIRILGERRFDKSEIAENN